MPSFDFFNKEKRRVRKYEKQKYRESVDRLSPRQKQIRQQELLEYKELVDKRRAERLERLERRRLETESMRSANSDYFNQLRGEENCRKTLYNQICAGGEPCTVTLDSCPEKGSVYWLD